MSITFFGILYLLFFVLFILLSKKKHIVQLLLISMTLQCDNVFVLNEKGIGPQIVGSILFIIYCLFFKKRNKTIVHGKRTSLCLYGCFIVFLTLTMPLTSSILSLLQLVIYLACAVCLYNNNRLISEFEFEKCIIKTIKFVLFIGILQFLCSAYILPKFILLPFIFNDDLSGVDVQFYYDFPHFRLFSTFQEPSFCAPFLVGSFFYLLQQDDRLIKFRKLLLFLFIELFITFSSTCYGCFLVLLSIYLFTRDRKIFFKYLFPIVFAGGILFILFGNTILDEVLFNKMNSSSASARNWWNLDALEHFNSSPVIGTGFQSVRASSYFLGLLGETGIVGTAIFMLFVFSVVKPILSKSFTHAYIISTSSRYFVLASIVCMFIACPDHNMTVFWFSIYVFAYVKDYSAVSRIS